MAYKLGVCTKQGCFAYFLIDDAYVSAYPSDKTHKTVFCYVGHKLQINKETKLANFNPADHTCVQKCPYDLCWTYYYLPKLAYDKLVETGSYFYCPSGHALTYKTQNKEPDTSKNLLQVVQVDENDTQGVSI